MSFTEIELPSNSKFGNFFTFVFGLAAAYFYINDSISWAYFMTLGSVIFLIITIVKADILLPLNKLWIRFGLLLGMIVSPVVLGVIFFGMFTPIAFFMGMSGRDELQLKFNKKPSYWISRSDPIQSHSFKHQF